MVVATMTSKGQITVPKEVREALGLKAGSKVSFVRDESGGYVMRAKTGSIKDLYGMLKWDGPAKTIEEMDEGIAQGAAETMRLV
jgi:AbrB family looped-hinge helix DNA binding protein